MVLNRFCHAAFLENYQVGNRCFGAGIITASGCPNSCLGLRYFNATLASDSSGSKSVKLAIRGKRITVTLRSFEFCGFYARADQVSPQLETHALATELHR